MEKSYKLVYFAMVALVFVAYYFVIGAQDAVGSTIRSVLLVGLASVLTWMVVREQRKKGRAGI